MCPDVQFFLYEHFFRSTIFKLQIFKRAFCHNFDWEQLTLEVKAQIDQLRQSQILEKRVLIELNLINTSKNVF